MNQLISSTSQRFDDGVQMGGHDDEGKELNVSVTAEPSQRLQDDIRVNGWAIECRITAEDPFNDFLPSGGRVSGLAQPSGPGVRVDSGVYEGSVISAYYDSLLAKLIVWGENRCEAISRMRRALREYRITGIETSIPFHRQVMEPTGFVSGSYDTSFLERHLSMRGADRQDLGDVAVIAAVLLHHKRRQRPLTAPSAHHGCAISPWKLTGRREAMGR